MKLFLKLTLSIALTIVAVAFSFAFIQSRQEQDRLQSELERRSSLLADGILESLVIPIRSENAEQISRVVDKFTQRERLLGVSLSLPDGAPVAVSNELFAETGIDAAQLGEDIEQVKSTKLGYGRFLVSRGGFFHVYSVPVLSDDTVTHTLTLVHDAGYIRDRIQRMWQTGFLRAFVQTSLVSLIVLILIYFNVLNPIRHTVEWIRSVRRGETPPIPSRHKMFAPLEREVSEMALSLQMARLAAEEEARLRQSQESLWTPERLKEFVRAKIGSRSVFVVANREPYMHVLKGKEIQCIVPASGLVTAIEPILKACGGTWIAMGAGDADRQTADAQDRLKVPPEEPQYVLRRVWITPEEEKGYYYGFSNEGLWPLCHVAHTRPAFRESDWLQYCRANRKFADALLEEMKDAPEPLVLVQDYHFALLPKLIKSARPDARIALFWHIPWPNPESFGICPWQREILEGMLGADIVGFHTQYHCNNFIETVDRTLECRIDYEHFTITREGQTTHVRSFPISIAFTGDANGQPSPKRRTASELLKPYGLQADYLAVGVDRLDYTKGIVERFQAVEAFLKRNPEFIGRFTFVELGAPSRTLIPRYQEFITEIEDLAERINAQFGRGKNWKPILLLKKHHSHQDIQPFYETANVCMVTSLHDGMNLVAKEFVASRGDEQGVLILSQFTGASRDMRDALVVNPYDIAQVAEAIRTAIEMPADEQRRRMHEMREALRERNIYRWAGDMIHELCQVRTSPP